MIIGLVGLKNSGKDSLVKLLEQEKDIKVYNLKFARGLKDILEKYFYIPSSIYENSNLKEKKIKHLKKSARELMIEIGTYFRKIDNDCWINYIDNYLQDLETYNSSEEDLSDKKVFYIFTDVRFKNEINYIKQSGGIIIDVDRTDLYVKEKKLINSLGNNFLTRFIMRFKNKSLSVNSEWGYWENKKWVDRYLDNTDLEKALETLKEILRIF